MLAELEEAETLRKSKDDMIISIQVNVDELPVERSDDFLAPVDRRGAQTGER
jgi:hypothetical protein